MSKCSDATKIYVAPTPTGGFFLLLILIMVLASANYGLNAGFALASVLASLVWIGVLHTWRNVQGLDWQATPSAAVYEGDIAALAVTVTNPHSRFRRAVSLCLHDDRSQCTTIDLPPRQTLLIHCPWATKQIGHHPWPRLRIETCAPLGLWRAWTLWEAEASLWVYPRPEAGSVPAPPGTEQRRSDSPGEEFSGVRPWRQGDLPSRIDWRTVSRLGALHNASHPALFVRATDAPWKSTPWALDYAALSPLPHRQRLARLSRWITEADQARCAWSLQWPQGSIALGVGESHRHAGLQALAMMPNPETSHGASV